jgi:hypothetical protein
LSSPPIPEKEVADWFSNPVTQLFYKHIDKAIADCHEDKRHAFHPANPQATQERHVWLLGAEWAFGEMKAMQDDEQIGEVEYEPSE